ncbi:MAG: aromatic amino acid lyase [Acidobacteria bacterium]|nr:aromatic amino acid lyase [Acidobacteriota bacterium]
MTIELTGNNLTTEQFRRVVFDSEPVALAASARTGVERSRALVEQLVAENKVAYGITTGFGDLARVRIPPDQLRALQLNLIRSHASGVGAPLSETESRATLLLRANVLAKGLSGVRPVLLETLLAMLNHGVHPVIPCRGSVGASGDLAPLAHLALVLVGEGEAFVDGQRMKGSDALKKARIQPITLEAKEGQPINAETAALLFGLGRACGTLGQKDDALGLMTRAFDYYVEVGDVAQAVAVARNPVPHLPGQLEGATELIRQALTLVPPDSAEAGQLLSLYCMALGVDEGDYQGAQEALAIEDAYDAEQIRGDEPRYWEDVQASESLTLIVRGPLTSEEIIQFIGATRPSPGFKRFLRYRQRHPDAAFLDPETGSWYVPEKKSRLTV